MTDANGEKHYTRAVKLAVDGFTIDDVTYGFLEGNNVAVLHYNGNSASVVIPSIVNYEESQYYVIEIGEKAFYNNKSITSISLPNAIEVIRAQAFKGCTELTLMTSHD